jgi:hypothetical protein
MDNFLDLYDEYLEKILYAVNNYSGKHSINKEKAEEWINSQPFPEAQEAARNIIKHTKYITLKEVYNNIENLVINQYKTLVEKNENLEKKIVMIVGKPEKSFFFISVLAVYFMKKHNLRIPDEFHSTFIDFNTNKTDIIICFDDMSYTGSQMGEMLKNSIDYNSLCELCDYINKKYDEYKIINNEMNQYLKNIKEPKDMKKFDGEIKILNIQNKLINYLDKLINNLNLNYLEKDALREEIKKDLFNLLSNIQFPDINIFLLGLNKHSLKKLTSFTKNYTYIIFLSKVFEFHYENPFHINYYEMIPLIEELVHEKELYYIVYYFSFMICPNVLLYYDFKIADTVSTIANVYNYGAIVPENFDLYNYFPLIKEIIENNKILLNKSFDTLNAKERYNYLIIKYYTIPSNEPIFTKTTISFYPFLNNCYQVYSIINDTRMKDLNYLLMFITDDLDMEFIDEFLSDMSVIEYSSRNISETEIILFIVLNEISKNNEKKSVEEIKKEILDTYNFIELIEKQKCGLSFYKNPDYKITYDETLSANINGGRKNMTMKKYKTKRTPKKKYKTNITKRFCKLKKSKKCNILYKKYKKNTI